MNRVDRIPDSEIRTHGDTRYVTRKQIKQYHGGHGLKSFAKWFGVGTCPIVDGEENAFYAWDYLDWLAGKKNLD